jgi:uncharacterized membrane protein YidH (DUF202 family)
MAVDLIPSVNGSDLISSFWTQGFPVLLDKAAPLISVLQAVGVVLIVYWIFLIVRGINRFKDHRRLMRIEEKLDSLLEILGKEKSSKKQKKTKK